ncbi:hypothetical protein, partial [Streptomyces sp. NPDC059970]|uniref:hypothetical protein n=1 Tax=Streptomyces sp. NPDC059970 TaxID=3347019 RepID=UPI0036A1668D
MDRSGVAYGAARNGAGQHGAAGERTTSQARRAFVLAFTEPGPADGGLELAQQLLSGPDLRGSPRRS